jgi:Tfp pilus assembly protein PilW
MKVPNYSFSRRRAATLVELMVAMVTAVIAMGAILGSYIYGLKTTQFIKPKLGASDEARKAISLLVDEVRSAKLVRIGNGSLNSFTEVAPWARQQGSAIQVYPTTNYSTPFVRYFWDSADQKLKRTTNGTSSAMVIANSVSNQMIFTSEDFSGMVLSNNNNNRVIGMTLQFFQIQYPETPVGPGNYYDYYQLSTKITRRTPF